MLFWSVQQFCKPIFILLSIKTRIETVCICFLSLAFIRFLSYYPLKQGLKPMSNTKKPVKGSIFILLSIKTRIETPVWIHWRTWIYPFLSYYPLKQGLKLYAKRGKLCSICIFILLSIKTRIETIRKYSYPRKTTHFYPTIH